MGSQLTAKETRGGSLVRTRLRLSTSLAMEWPIVGRPYASPGKLRLRSVATSRTVAPLRTWTPILSRRRSSRQRAWIKKSSAAEEACLAELEGHGHACQGAAAPLHSLGSPVI